MDKKNNEEEIKGLCTNNISLFIYNSMTDQNSKLGYDYKKLQKSQHVVIKFTIHAINFCPAKATSKIFNYNFWLHSAYLENRGLWEVLTPSKRKQSPDKWLISLFSTNKSIGNINLLD